MRSVELFAGAGGLAMGMSKAGFHHAAVLEWNHDACETFRENSNHLFSAISEWPLIETDVRKFDFKQISDVAVISGGPPCQPFSLGGKHGGCKDDRDMFPEAVRAVRTLRPKAFIFENVKGLLRQSFSSYFEYIYLQLTHPSLIRRAKEKWQDHRYRLEKHHTAKTTCAEYNVLFRLLNAADYGVPQRRERVFLVGFRSDLAVDWGFPHATHSEDSLMYSKWVTGKYWQEHSVSMKYRSKPPEGTITRLRKLGLDGKSGKSPWRTVRDAIAGLPDPERSIRNTVSNHRFMPGARIYPGHTGSPLDEPAKTLKAGDHGVPGGENMVVREDGSVRYFTVREAARLQCFPDDYVFRGSWTEAMRQLGNAVPVTLAEVIAGSIRQSLQRNGEPPKCQ